MKQMLSRRVVMGSVALACAVLMSPVALAQTKSVGITAYVDHPALDAARKGVEDELKALGWESGKNLKLQYQSAQGNAATTGQIAALLVLNGGFLSIFISAVAIGTFLGGSALAKDSPEALSTLRERVTSKGGTTYAALTVLQDDGVAASLGRAIEAADRRAAELGDEFGR